MSKEMYITKMQRNIKNAYIGACSFDEARNNVRELIARSVLDTDLSQKEKIEVKEFGEETIKSDLAD